MFCDFKKLKRGLLMGMMALTSLSAEGGNIIEDIGDRIVSELKCADGIVICREREEAGGLEGAGSSREAGGSGDAESPGDASSSGDVGSSEETESSGDAESSRKGGKLKIRRYNRRRVGGVVNGVCRWSDSGVGLTRRNARNQCSGLPLLDFSNSKSVDEQITERVKSIAAENGIDIEDIKNALREAQG